MLAAMALLTAWPISAIVPLGAAVFVVTVLALRGVRLADLREMREAVWALASPAGTGGASGKMSGDMRGDVNDKRAATRANR